MSENPIHEGMHEAMASAEGHAKTIADAGQTAIQAGVQAAQTAGRNMNEMTAKAMGEFTRMFSEMKVPMMPDMDALMQAHRRNLETLSAANRVAMEGAQAVARRNMEILQQTMSELTDGLRAMAAGESPQAKAAQQADLIKASYERAVANLHEIGDLLQRSNGEALSLLNKRFAESMEEVKTLLAKSTAAGV